MKKRLGGPSSSEQFVSTTEKQKLVAKRRCVASDKRSAWKPQTLVLSGGGAKGPMMAGAFFVLDSLGKLSDLKCIGATSIGALFGALYCCGYETSEIIDVAVFTDFRPMDSKSIPEIIRTGTLKDGKWFHMWVRERIKAKVGNPDITLKQLYERSGLKLEVCTLCLEQRKEVYISHETYPDLTLSTAVMMACSLPIIFDPVIYAGYHYIDGGLVNNYMINRYPPETTLGIKLGIDPSEQEPSVISTRVETMTAALSVSEFNLKNVFKRLRSSAEYLVYIMELRMDMTEAFRIGSNIPYEINIPTSDVKFLDFKMSPDARRELVNRGMIEATRFCFDHRPK